MSILSNPNIVLASIGLKKLRLAFRRSLPSLGSGVRISGLVLGAMALVVFGLAFSLLTCFSAQVMISLSRGVAPLTLWKAGGGGPAFVTTFGMNHLFVISALAVTLGMAGCKVVAMGVKKDRTAFVVLGVYLMFMSNLWVVIPLGVFLVHVCVKKLQSLMKGWGIRSALTRMRHRRDEIIKNNPTLLSAHQKSTLLRTLPEATRPASRRRL
jgi:hypothetical protein